MTNIILYLPLPCIVPDSTTRFGKASRKKPNDWLYMRISNKTSFTGIKSLSHMADRRKGFSPSEYGGIGDPKIHVDYQHNDIIIACILQGMVGGVVVPRQRKRLLEGLREKSSWEVALSQPC